VTQVRHRNVRTILLEQAVNPVLPSSAAFVAHETHHLLFRRSLTERIRTVGHRHNQLSRRSATFRLRCPSFNIGLFARGRGDDHQLRRIIRMRPSLPKRSRLQESCPVLGDLLPCCSGGVAGLYTEPESPPSICIAYCDQIAHRTWNNIVRIR
jgi:hypothetical protein